MSRDLHQNQASGASGTASTALRQLPWFLSRLERERRLLLSWAKAGKDSKESREATRSEGDDLEESAARALMRHKGRGRGVRG